MTTIEQRAREWAEDAFVFHWQARVKAEQENKAPFGQLTTVKTCYEYGYSEGIREGLRVAITVIQGNNDQLFASKFFADAYLMGRARDAEVLQKILDGKAELPKEASGDNET